MKPRIVVFSISALAATLREIARDYLSQANIEIVPKAYEEALAYAQQRYYADTADVFVAAGSNGAFLVNHLEFPLVLIRTDGFDLMKALAAARRVSSHVALVTYESTFEELSQFSRAFDLSIPSRTYRTPEDARRVVLELTQGGTRAIVGPGLVTELASDMGVEGVLIYSRQGVVRAFDEAIRLATAKASAGPRAVRQSYMLHQEQDILGSSTLIQNLRSTIRMCGSCEFSVLIEGETGVGKELVAQSIHSSSSRAGRSFIAINCAALTESLLESELFGYEEGAFSGAVKGGRAGLFEAAQGGTVFLDEIGDMPLPFQTRLLRVLEEGGVRRIGSTISRKVDFRLLAASHVNLLQAVNQGKFREDLYYRLNELFIRIPSLRDRKEDLEELAGYFLRTTPVRVSKEKFDEFLALAMPVFHAYAWPGNIRQLKNVCRRAAVMLTQKESLHDWLSWFPDLYSENQKDSQFPEIETNFEGRDKQNLRETMLNELALQYRRAAKNKRTEIVRQALKLTQGEVLSAARALGISRSTFWRLASQVSE